MSLLSSLMVMNKALDVATDTQGSLARASSGTVCRLMRQALYLVLQRMLLTCMVAYQK
jgi:hypothetical protein